MGKQKQINLQKKSGELDGMKGWRILKKHILEMKHKPNFLLKYKEEKNDIDKEQLQMIHDKQTQGENFSLLDGNDVVLIAPTDKKLPLQNAIIIPPKSGWYRNWTNIVTIA